MTVRLRAGAMTALMAVLLGACTFGEEPDDEAVGETALFEVRLTANACPEEWEVFEECLPVLVPDAEVVITVGDRVLGEGRTDQRGEFAAEVPVMSPAVVTVTSSLFDFELGGPDFPYDVYPDNTVHLNLRAPGTYVLHQHEGPPPQELD